MIFTVYINYFNKKKIDIAKQEVAIKSRNKSYFILKMLLGSWSLSIMIRSNEKEVKTLGNRPNETNLVIERSNIRAGNETVWPNKSHPSFLKKTKSFR